MTLIVNDRVQEVSTSTGSGPFVLGGGVTGYQTFSVGIGNTNSTYYTITNGTNWMDILGTYTSAANSITVDKILTSSAGGTTAVSFAAGTKNIFCTYPAATAVLAAPATYPTIQPSLNLDFANTKQLDPRITFVRNSTAAYYDGQTSALAEQNLLVQSQLFSATPWSIYNSTATNNTTTAPDGTTTAASCIENTTVSNGHGFFQSYTTSANTYVGSAYVKTLTRQYAYIGIYDTPTSAYSGVIIDLIAGTILSTRGTLVSSSIVSLGSGWYRVNITKIMTATASALGIFLSDSATPTYLAGRPSYTGDGTSGIYTWGAQLEQRSAVTAYTPTTTAAITNYIPVLMTAPAGVARFDCDPITGNSLGLLIEESRTNLLLYSATFSNAAWTLTNATLTAAATIAPDGTQTAFNLVSNTSTGLQAIAQTVTKAASALAYTSTVHFKANQYTYSWLQISDGAGNGAIVYFNLTTGAISTAVAGIGTAFTALSATTPTSIGNGWYRCNITGTSNTATSLVTQFGSSTNGTSNSVVGNGYSGVYAWGCSLEAGSFAASYIPTVASTVTRAADQASMTGTNFSSWYNQAQGTVYFEALTTTAGTDKYNFEIGDGTTNNRISALSQSSNQDAYVIVNGSVLANANLAISRASSIKGAIRLKVNDICSAFNGTLGVADTFSTLPNVNTLYLGSARSGLVPLNGTISKIAYYPVALSSSNLVALTS